MPWFVPWSESIKKRACRYLLQRYLGQFFEEKLTLDQLSVNLYNGTGTVADVSLDVQALNELGEQQNWPMEFVDGYIEQMSISVPWSALLKDSSNVEVRGLNVTIQPKQRSENATSMFESMWSSMTSSMQLAQECLKQELPNAVDNAQPLEGIERFAQTIDSILSRVKVRFVNTVIRLEHVPKDCATGVALQMNIHNLEYLDEAGDDPPTSEATELISQDESKAYVVSSFTLKKFILEGVTFSSEEFPSRARTFSRSMMSQSQSSVNLEQSKVSDDVFLSTIIEDSIIKKSSDSTRESSVETTPINDVPSSQFPLEGVEHEPILFGKLSGRQEIRVRLKQSESISGPKISMEMTFGSLMLFLSPRQLHVLLELADGVASPHLEDTSNVPSKSRCAEKPMGGLDFQRIEQELQQHLNPIPSLAAGLQHTKGWSASFDDDDNDDRDFLPMRNQTISDSIISSTNSMDSSVSTSISSASSRGTPLKNHRRNSEKIPCLDLDPTAEITHFQIRLASLAIVLLHEDILTLSTGSEATLVPSSVTHLKHTAEMFFESLGPFGITGYGNKDFDNAKETFEKSCQLNHIRLLSAPIQVEGDQKSTLTAHALSLNLTAAKLEVLECLWNGTQDPVEYVKLLSEIEDTQTSRVIGVSPFLRVGYNHIEKIAKHSHQKCPNKTEISINFNRCITEVDITIVDRICAVLNPQPICNGKGSPKPGDTTAPFSQATQDSSTSEYKYDIKIAAPIFTIKLRFPIPDFRQPHDMQRTPWWKRNVRPDFLTLQMNDANMVSSICSSQTCFKYEVQCRQADLHYTDESLGTPLHIARISVDDKCGSLPGFNWPRFVMEIYPLLRNPSNLDDGNLGGLETEELLSMRHSMDGFGEIRDDSANSKNPNPFSSKKVVHESDTPHTRQQQSDGATEELIIPGDRQEMSNFIEYSTRSSRLRLELFVPTLSVQLVSKHIYELLYNRINSDLLLWEPNAPRPQTNYGINPNISCDLQESIYPMFSMCKSGIQYDSESDSDDESGGESEGVFYSICESKLKSKQMENIFGQSFLSFNIHILQGILCMNPPVRDTSLNVIPEQQGELLLIVEDASIFTVSQYMGDPDLSYVCVQSVSACLHHSDLTATPSQSAPLKEIGCTLPRHLYMTIYKSEPGVAVQTNGLDRCGQRDMVSVAIRIQANHETHHIKTIRVAVGIRLATLRHRMCAEPNSWFTQMIDFFDVLDYPIPGYNPMAVLTEFHLHLWDCAIDYRPFNLPIRSLLALGNFSMSSHLAAQVNTSTLRFIAEECYLFLSDKAPPKGRVPSIAPVDLRRDYVCVVELSLFELSLRLTDRQRGVPHIDLRASNNIVHIRTCSDTARALMQLITYFATDGDLAKDGSVSSEQSTPRKQASSEQLLNVEPQEISGLSTSQHQQVNELLGEAMKESLVAPVQTDLTIPEGDPSAGTDVFFFPDESRPAPDVPILVPPPIDKRLSHRSSDTDEEFCFVGDEAGLGILPKSGLPEIRWLTEEPVRIIDNHFTVPVGKTDLLKPPKHFPPAVLRYTLCEMTLVWHIYGGHDFQSTEKATQKKTVNFLEDKAKIQGAEVSFSKNDANRVVFQSPIKEKKEALHGWRTKGGIKRDHDVLMELQLNKVRFQHEVYPEDTTQASRQVLLVSEVEVRDRLASSHFNKFLYQHTSQARPKQSHANMIVIKATHVRPDPKLSAQECILRVSILPLRLNVDQDSLLFLVQFFNELGGQDTDKVSGEGESASRHATPTHQPPVMTVTMDNTEEVKQQAQKLVSDNLLILLEEDEESTEDDGISENRKQKSLPPVGEETPPIYFRNVLFSPEVPIRLDYQGKHVDMSHGPLAGLLMGLGQLNCSELRLKRLSHRHGLLGIDKLLSYALHEWLQDIKRHQLPSLLGGFGPMHSFVQLFQGIRDLFWLPIEQYQKDGRLVRGLQRGANSFTTSTAMAALELTSRIIHLIQATAETAYDMVSPGPSVRRRVTKGKKGRRRHYSQPQDIREGMANAYMVVKEGIGETAGTIVRVASQEHEQKGYSGAVGGVLRQIPPTFVKPIIIASEATNNVLGGMRSQLVPDARREASQKWRTEDG